MADSLVQPLIAAAGSPGGLSSARWRDGSRNRPGRGRRGRADQCRPRRDRHLHQGRAALAVLAFLATAGLLMVPILPAVVGILLLATLVYGLALDFAKVTVVAGLRID
jgi:hypothetical protein